MAYERRYQVCLRVFEPLDAHPELGDYPVSDNRAMIEELVAADADARLISFPPDPIADSHNWSRWIQDPSAERCHRIASLPAMTWEFVPVLPFGG